MIDDFANYFQRLTEVELPFDYVKVRLVSSQSYADKQTQTRFCIYCVSGEEETCVFKHTYKFFTRNKYLTLEKTLARLGKYITYLPNMYTKPIHIYTDVGTYLYMMAAFPYFQSRQTYLESIKAFRVHTEIELNSPVTMVLDSSEHNYEFNKYVDNTCISQNTWPTIYEDGSIQMKTYREISSHRKSIGLWKLI